MFQRYTDDVGTYIGRYRSSTCSPLQLPPSPHDLPSLDLLFVGRACCGCGRGTASPTRTCTFNKAPASRRGQPASKRLRRAKHFVLEEKERILRASFPCNIDYGVSSQQFSILQQPTSCTCARVHALSRPHIHNWILLHAPDLRGTQLENTPLDPAGHFPVF